MAAPGTVTLFSKNKDDYRINDITAGTMKVALVTSSWTPDTSVTGNSVWADMSANEISGTNGYTTGGVTPGTLVATAISGGYKLSSANASWTASGGSIAAWRYAVFYMSGSLWGMTNPVVGYFVGDSAPADSPATASGNTLTLVPPSGGWFDIT